MSYQAHMLYGQPVLRDHLGIRVTLDDTTYMVGFDNLRDAYQAIAVRNVMVNGEKKIMRIKESVVVDDAALENSRYDAATTALMLAVQKLEPLVEYRLRELTGDDGLSPDPAIDNAIEIQTLADEAERLAQLEQVSGWGAWG